ncbi:MAG: glycosyltransferase [Bauldia sp.]
MRIVFFDLSGQAYTAETPYKRPLGGSQSAICYLAAELAQRGHQPVLVNATTASGSFRGVAVSGIAEGGQPAFLRSADAIVVLNAPQGTIFRRDVGFAGPLVLWLTHAPDQPDVGRLADRNERAAWSAFAFVSDWQQRAYVARFGGAFAGAQVMRNAMAPPFASAQVADAWFATGAPPTLAYTSMPFRGLDVLLDAFPAIREGMPEVALKIYSGMATYQVPPDRDGFGGLYAQAASMPGVAYVGPIGQADLAVELSRVAALAYPSTFAETSCIAAIEAMAAGAEVIATDHGALAETTAGYAHLVEMGTDRSGLVAAFAERVLSVLRSARADPGGAALLREARVTHAKARYNWPERAAEWEDWLRSLVAARN